MWRLNCLIHASGTSGNEHTIDKGMLDFLEDSSIENADSIATIKYTIRWQASLSNGVQNDVNTETFLEEVGIPPSFRVEAGIVNINNGATIPDDIIQDSPISNYTLSNTKRNDHGYSSQSPHPGMNERSYSDGLNEIARITSFGITNPDNTIYAHQAIVEVLFEGCLSWQRGEIPMNNLDSRDILLKIEEESPSFYGVPDHEIAPANAEGNDELLWYVFYPSHIKNTDNKNSINPGSNPSTYGASTDSNTEGWRRNGMHNEATSFPKWTRYFVDKIDIEIYNL